MGAIHFVKVRKLSTNDVPTFIVTPDPEENVLRWADILVAIGAAPNKRHARELIRAGAVSYLYAPHVRATGGTET